MRVHIVDNYKDKVVSTLIPAIESAIDVRIAVAFVSGDGLAFLMPSIKKVLDAHGYVEFLIGMDPHVTDPHAVHDLYAMSRENPQLSLLCIAARNAAAIYHPKMYLARDNNNATAIIGSSNLTRRGLTSNIEANVVIQDILEAEIFSEIYNAYSRHKFHIDRVIPDDEFISVFEDLCHAENARERKFSRDREIRQLKTALFKKAENLRRPKPTKNDLIGWLELVYDVLPEKDFSNHDIYRFERGFQERYPQNLNIRAKIRQQLQILREMGLLVHVDKGVWRKVS